MDLNGSSLELIIDRLTTPADGVMAVDLRSPSGAELPAWTPGSHIDLRTASGIVRQYSLCGDAGDQSSWRVAVRRDPRSRGGSAYVHDNLREGDRVCASPPRNNFPLVSADRHLLIAGGIGITPLLPMVRELARRREPWHLWYVGRSRTSMPFLDELSAYGGRVTVLAGDEGRRLDVAQLLAVPQTRTAVYCCGPSGLLDALGSACAGWPEGALRTERFAAAERPGADAASFSLRLDRTGVTVEVPADKSILEVAESAGAEVAFSCREGVCGSCETFVLDGEPDHRDSVLSEAERRSGESLMPCVSRSASPLLVLDL